MAMFSSITQRLRSMSEHNKFGDMVPVLDYYVDEQLLHIPADHEHQFRFNVNTISGPM